MTRRVRRGKYSRHLSETLSAKLDEFLSAPHHEQLALYEELAVARAQALDALKMWDAATGSKPQIQAMATAVVRDALEFVKDMVLATSRVEKDAEDKVSVRVLDLFIEQVLRCVSTHVDDETMELIDAEVKKYVRFPDDDSSRLAAGTTLTPDEVVQEMDERSAPDEPTGDDERDGDGAAAG